MCVCVCNYIYFACNSPIYILVLQNAFSPLVFAGVIDVDGSIYRTNHDYKGIPRL